MNIQGSVALVTGANRGIGKAIVAALLAAGAGKVYAAARDVSGIERDPKVIPLKLDVTKPADIEAAAKIAKDVTVLINNAGVLDWGGPLEVTDAQLDRNFAANFFAPLNLARAFAPVIEANGGGALANLLTIVALASMPALAGYNASKAASWSMTQSLRAALSAKKISVHAVFPGPVDTDMAAGIPMAKTSPADVALAIVNGIQAGKQDIFPDPMSASVYEAWAKDHKAVEAQFAA